MSRYPVQFAIVVCCFFAIVAPGASAESIIKLGEEAPDTQGTASIGNATVSPIAGGRTILEAIRAEPRYSLFAAMIDISGVPEALTDGGPVTVFVPDNSVAAAAFDAFMKGYDGDRYEARVRKLVLAHVVPQQFSIEDLAYNVAAVRRFGMETASRDALDVKMSGERLMIFDESGQAAPIARSLEDLVDGIIHELDGVMLKPR